MDHVGGRGSDCDGTSWRELTADLVHLWTLGWLVPHSVTDTVWLVLNSVTDTVWLVLHSVSGQRG